MKKILSISLGSSSTDHETVVSFGGDQIKIIRRGCNGNIALAAELLKESDGKFDVLGLGGINFCYQLQFNNYPLPQATYLRTRVCRSPIVDGGNVKKFVEPLVVRELCQRQGSLKGIRVLLVSALDRYWLGKAFEDEGAKVYVGDAKFGLNLPILFGSLRRFEIVARLAMPVLRFIPIQHLYPLGSRQDGIGKPWPVFYGKADVIAGDFHFIKRHLPEDLSGKILITSTATKNDIEILRQRGVKEIYTTTPEWNGRRFGANVLEAILVVLGGTRWYVGDYRRWLAKIGCGPGFLKLN